METESLTREQLVFELNKMRRRVDELEESEKQRERTLRREKALMDALMDHIPDSIYFKDKQCRLVRINRKMMHDLELKDESQAIGKTDVDLFGEEFGHKCLNEDRRLIETGEPVISLLESRKLNDGRINWTLTSKVPIRNEKGQIVGLVGITREINELKKAEQELERERELLQALMDNFPDTIYFKDTSSRFTRINKAQARVIGIDNPEEATGRSDFDYFPPEHATEAFEDEQKIMKTGQPLISKTEKIKKADGSFFWVIATKVPIIDKNGEIIGLVGVSRDITDRKLIEDKLQASLKEKEVLLREIHHRVKNNMQIISSLLRLQSNAIEDKKATQLIRECENRIRAMAFIHEQIYKTKDLANIDFSEYVTTLSTKLIRIYSRDPNLITSSIHCQNVYLNVNTAIPAGLIINELITNSLEHAFDANQKGEIFVEIRSDGGVYTLRIGDDGMGFPEDLDFRNTESLGLNLVVNLVDQLDGTIELNREKGTEFAIRFKMVGA